MQFNNMVVSLLEGYSSISANRGIVFRENKGCCIGVEHGKNIRISKDLIERIKNIPNLKFYAEGVAAKQPEKEPGMMPFMNKNFPGVMLEKLSWDEITEAKNKGAGNPRYNVVYLFMQHKYNKTIDLYTYTNGTMLEALARPKIKNWPNNSPQNYEERLAWITKHMKAAGFYEKLNRPYNRNKLYKLLTEMEYSVYPNQQYPDTNTYFGNFQQKLEEERNKTIYDLMGQGGCCFAGAGHLIELKQQFPNLEIIDEERI